MTARVTCDEDVMLEEVADRLRSSLLIFGLAAKMGYLSSALCCRSSAGSKSAVGVAARTLAENDTNR